MKFNIVVKLPGEDIRYSYDEKVPIEEIDRKLSEELKDGVLKIHVPNSYNLHLIPVFNNVREIFLEITDPSEQVPEEMKKILESDTNLE
jgi:hypothetical protein